MGQASRVVESVVSGLPVQEAVRRILEGQPSQASFEYWFQGRKRFDGEYTSDPFDASSPGMQDSKAISDVLFKAGFSVLRGGKNRLIGTGIEGSVVIAPRGSTITLPTDVQEVVSRIERAFHGFSLPSLGPVQLKTASVSYL